jgi:NADPH:quinone reductase-like Zn-dependent oxidoreductase
MQTMKAVVTTGNGGYDKLEYKDVPVPSPGDGEVLLRVLAAGVNNTEINTRVGWYSASVTSATNAAADTEAPADVGDGGWNEATPFPFIQGTDCCGRVEAVGAGVDEGLIGTRVLVRPCIRKYGFDSLENIWMGSDFDGAFAEYVRVPAAEAFPIESDWSDEELATIPCAYGTSENMLHRSALGSGERVLVAGASGGVGSATVQLARRRGAHVIAIAGQAKMERVREVGAHEVVARGADLVSALGKDSVDVIIDNVGGESFPQMLDVLKRGGRYATSGAIGGPIVELDLRTMYLKDQTLIGCTAWDEPVFPNLIGYIQRHEIKPLLARSYPLSRIADAQRDFLKKEHVGKFVLVPQRGGLV